ncbi:hypothetical protein [Nostoc sp. MS1]|uniref:hypothetical protein n=1 Tax=Nostoc sp. MS1 TaxID=2764711 RepID=UPI001CC73990|nr:hypothetical protein [Nostoc sp. MS1]BCL34252.1 hypothetical protein NSMS1_06990 [Nostoc sp. MS1]
MAWLESIHLSSVPGQWVTTPVIVDDLVKINHNTSGLNNSFFTGTIAQCELDENNELIVYDERIIKADSDTHLFKFEKPEALTNRRIAFKADPYALLAAGQVWNWNLEISEYFEPVVLNWASNGDTNGILYYLGTNAKTQDWVNPHVSGKVVCSISSGGNGNIATLADRQLQGNYTPDVANSWVGVNLKDVKLKLTRYAFRHDVNTGYYARSWRLDGSNNGIDWITLDNQTNNTQINAAGAWASIPINITTAYQQFRITMTDRNSSSSYEFCCSELEFYGELA